MPRHERPQHGDLLGAGVAVSGRAPGQDIGDVDGGAGILRGSREPGRFEHSVEKLPGPSDEGLALAVLVAPGSLADDHRIGARIAIREDQLPRPLLEIAQIERLHRAAQFLQRSGGGCGARGDLGGFGGIHPPLRRRPRGRIQGGDARVRILLALPARLLLRAGRGLGGRVAVDRRFADGLAGAELDVPFELGAQFVGVGVQSHDGHSIRCGARGEGAALAPPDCAC